MRPFSADRSCFVEGLGMPHRCSTRITAKGYAIAEDGFAAPPALPEGGEECGERRWGGAGVRRRDDRVEVDKGGEVAPALPSRLVFPQ
eukprot:1835968-Pleurochrysis_carterae.AAC.1